MTEANPPSAALRLGDAASRGYKRPESVLVVVHTPTRVLLLRRTDEPRFWQSVTGSMHWDETSPLVTAVRELREETGLEVPPSQLRDWGIQRRYQIFPRWRHRYAPGTIENTEHQFSLALPAESAIYVNPAEHSEYAWLGFGEAAARVFSWTNRAAIEALARAGEDHG
jgi:dATP pyrophosphohydrolase